MTSVTFQPRLPGKASNASSLIEKPNLKEPRDSPIKCSRKQQSRHRLLIEASHEFSINLQIGVSQAINWSCVTTHPSIFFHKGPWCQFYFWIFRKKIMKEVPREQFGINFSLTNLNARLLRYLKVIQNTVLDLNQNLRRKSKGNRQVFDCSCK